MVGNAKQTQPIGHLDTTAPRLYPRKMNATRSNLRSCFGTAQLAALAPAIAITVLALAMAAGLPETAGALGELATTLAVYTLLLPAVGRRLYDFVPPEAGNPQVAVLTLFLAGAGLAVGQSLGTTSTSTSLTTVFFLLTAALAGRLYIKAWLAVPSALPIWSLTRLSAGAIALSALGGAVDGLGRISGLFRMPWLAAGVADGALLAVAFHATAVAAADRDQNQDVLRLPTHWPEMVTLAHIGAVATAIVQAWLTRYPGARVTALLVLTTAPLIVASMLLLTDTLRLRAADSGAWLSRAGAALLLSLTNLAFFAGAAMANLRAAGSLLLVQDAPVWPWGWRLPLALAAAAAYAEQWENSISRIAVPLSALSAAGIALLILGCYLWLWGSSAPWAYFLLGGVTLAAAALASMVYGGASDRD